MNQSENHPLPRCCRKHLHTFKKNLPPTHAHEIDFTCHHCQRKYRMDKIEHPDLNAGEDSWSHPMLIRERKVA